MAKLIIPTPLRKFTNGESAIETKGATVKDSIKELIAIHPLLEKHLLDDYGQIRPYIKLFVGEEDIYDLQNEFTPVKADSVISLVPAIAGGIDEKIILDLASSNKKIDFNNAEIKRYSRHLAIPEFNISGQRKLKASKVLVVGTGGLGSPLLLYLTAAGVGNIGIVDFDVVDESNLQRQILFNVDDVGKSKVEIAKKKLLKLNPYVNIKIFNTRLTSANALNIIKDYDVIADGTDNFPTRYLVNDACVLLDKPNVYASIFRFEGQVSVFNYKNKNGERGPNYRDLFPSPPPAGLVPSCAEGGVLGVLPGIIGSIQANEVIKVITGIGIPVSGKLFLLDALSFESKLLKISKNKSSSLITHLIDYEQFCGLKEDVNVAQSVKEITVRELKNWIDNKNNIQIIDVRESYEYEIANINGELISLDKIIESYHKIASDKPVVVHCKSGGRSSKAIQQLQKEYGFSNLYNLKGGILAWAKEVDETLPTY